MKALTATSEPYRVENSAMSTIVSFRDLKVWQLAMEFAERYGLTSQTRRAVVSIPSNLAEGHGRKDGAYLNHVRIAIGSQAELTTLLELSRRLHYLSERDAEHLLSGLRDIRKLLYGLKRSLELHCRQT
jgi:four helix bundle protein